MGPATTRSRRSARASATCCAPAAASASAAAASAAIVVRAMLDYRTLPFISSQSPYLESLRPDRAGAGRRRARDATSSSSFYGWSRAPALRVGHERLAAARCGVRADGGVARAVLGDRRARRRALPRLLPQRSRRHLRARLSGRSRAFGHLINLAELVIAGARAVSSLLLVGADAVQRARRRGRRRAAGRCCARSDRASTASCSSPSSPVAVVPVVILALATRTYFADAADAPASRRRRVKTATVAQRLVEDYAALQQRGAGGARPHRRPDHGARRPRDRPGRQPVRPRAAAGDERARPVRLAAAADAHAGEVYRSIVLDRLPTFVGDRGGRRRPLPARRRAGPRRRPRRASSRCPQTLRQQRDRATDRRARSAGAVRRPCCSCLLGAGARLLDGGADRRSGEPADARHAADRPRRSRRAHRRDVVRRAAAPGRGLQPDGRRSASASAPSSSARSGSRRGPTWRGRSRTTSRTR